jgi:quaternary ammonium compound-resistance protein SugE
MSLLWRHPDMAWICLLIGGLLEVAWAVGLKYTDGFTRGWPSIVVIGIMCGSFWFLTRALREIPMGTCYAVWTGIGVIGTAIIGMLFMGESRAASRVLCIGLIVAGTIGLRLLSAPAR